MLDFTDCTEVALSITGSAVYSAMKIATSNVEIVGLNLTASVSAGELCLIDDQAAVPTFRGCRFEGTAFAGVTLANNGIFENCKGVVKSTTEYADCFEPTTFLKVNGGDFRAYAGGGVTSYVLYQATANIVSLFYGVNLPTVAVTSYSQDYALYQTAAGGKIRATDLVTTLTSSTTDAEIRDTVAINKPNVL